MDDSSDSKLNLSQWPKQKHKVKQVYVAPTDEEFDAVIKLYEEMD